MQGNWNVCVPLKCLILMPVIQEAICFEFTVQFNPPPLLEVPGPPRFIFVYVLPCLIFMLHIG